MTARIGRPVCCYRASPACPRSSVVGAQGQAKPPAVARSCTRWDRSRLRPWGCGDHRPDPFHLGQALADVALRNARCESASNASHPLVQRRQFAGAGSPQPPASGGQLSGGVVEDRRQPSTDVAHRPGNRDILCSQQATELGGQGRAGLNEPVADPRPTLKILLREALRRHNAPRGT